MEKYNKLELKIGDRVHVDEHIPQVPLRSSDGTVKGILRCCANGPRCLEYSIAYDQPRGERPFFSFISVWSSSYYTVRRISDPSLADTLPIRGFDGNDDGNDGGDGNGSWDSTNIYK